MLHWLPVSVGLPHIICLLMACCNGLLGISGMESIWGRFFYKGECHVPALILALIESNKVSLFLPLSPISQTWSAWWLFSVGGSCNPTTNPQTIIHSSALPVQLPVHTNLSKLLHLYCIYIDVAIACYALKCSWNWFKYPINEMLLLEHCSMNNIWHKMNLNCIEKQIHSKRGG